MLNSKLRDDELLVRHMIFLQKKTSELAKNIDVQSDYGMQAYCTCIYNMIRFVNAYEALSYGEYKQAIIDNVDISWICSNARKFASTIALPEFSEVRGVLKYFTEADLGVSSVLD